MPVTIHRQWPLLATTIGGQASIHSICSYDECEFRGRESLQAPRDSGLRSTSLEQLCTTTTWRTVVTRYTFDDWRVENSWKSLKSLVRLKKNHIWCGTYIIKSFRWLKCNLQSLLSRLLLINYISNYAHIYNIGNFIRETLILIIIFTR